MEIRPLLVAVVAAILVATMGLWFRSSPETAPGDQNFPPSAAPSHQSEAAQTAAGSDSPPPSATADAVRALPGMNGDNTPANGPTPPEVTSSAPSEDASKHEHLKRSMPIHFHPSLPEVATRFRDDPNESVLTLQAFDGEELQLVLQRLRPHSERAAVMTGRVDGSAMSFFSLSYFGEAQSGSIHLPSREQVFEIHSGPDGLLYLSEINLAALGHCGACDPDLLAPPSNLPSP